MGSHDRIKQLEAALERIRSLCNDYSPPIPRYIPHFGGPLAAQVLKEIQAVLPRPNDVF